MKEDYTLKQLLILIISDESNSPSSKRIMGIISSLTLVFCLIATLVYYFINGGSTLLLEILIDSVLILALSLFGATVVDKVVKNISNKPIKKQ